MAPRLAKGAPLRENLTETHPQEYQPEAGLRIVMAVSKTKTKLLHRYPRGPTRVILAD